MTRHYNLLVGSAVALALSWAPYLIFGGEYVSALVASALTVVAAVGAVRWPAGKVVVVRAIQRRLVNPLVKALFARGINPLGLVLVETRGRRSGLPRSTPVGNGRIGDDLWVIAEHGLRANYVRNIQANPLVRVRIRIGRSMHWVEGVARVLPADDAAARQRQLVGRNPLRAFNAMTVQLMGADLVTVHIDLRPREAVDRGSGRSRQAAETARPATVDAYRTGGGLLPTSAALEACSWSTPPIPLPVGRSSAPSGATIATS